MDKIETELAKLDNQVLKEPEYVRNEVGPDESI